MRTAGRLLLLFSIAWAASWGAPVCASDQEQEGPPVRLVSPRAGATLVAGTAAELEWAPLELFADLSSIEEWEAFLSLDGGATYPVRITPHLDQDLRRIRWQVPDLPTSEAAILLRFGDERRETAVELPVRFAIAASPARVAGTAPLARQVSTPGEAARPGGPGVVVWVEGSRRGGSLRQVVAVDAAPGMRAGFTPPQMHHWVSETASEPLSSGPPGRLAAKGWGSEPPAGGRALAARVRTAPFLSSEILLLIQRQNE